jgi:4-azaleucine resistance transporter AzlC
MSILVFAGSSQFMAIGLIGNGASLLLIVLTTFFINLRNFLYSASLSPYFQPLSGGWKWFLAYPMADEVYATILVRARQGDLSAKELGWFAAGVGLNLISLWWTSTAVGALLGDILPPHLTQTLGFTLPLIFTSLIVPLLVTRPALLAALSAALASIILAPLAHNLGLLLASAIGIGVGVLVEKIQPVKMEVTPA